ncbi:hypothetical protein P5G86_18970 [Paenibacillus jamilae]|uniref:Uncharacterized protein n=1 Tax=Bacillus thuringiensis serovar subtoxicus TaxID=475791 RepID=A0A9X6IIC4_BACTU|nr:hypothetical protein [Bacillus thuringiensis]MEB4842082.1 hypothetical protein [Paenibacillus jamilae]MEB8580062.1 hypothetical protein [Bacillus cereus]MCR6850707.1 hypothetical protein [Bacillus thuringiensis]MDR4283840.1 hypothetical protein [Bacillus thuringiensis]MEB8593308.1 hypothetical protein [Bacillus cereus]
MFSYKKRIESLDELHKVIDALETLKKEYQIIKKIEWSEPKSPLPKLPKNVWYVEEVDTSKIFFTDADAIVKLVCKNCGISCRGKRNLLEGMSCIYCFNHNTTIVSLDKEFECK